MNELNKEFESLMSGLSNHIKFIYNQNCKPISIIFDIDRQKLILDFDHDKFIEIFGDSFHIGEIQQYGDSYVLERIISILDVLVILKVNIFKIEMINKKLSKIYTN
jgi:hypothetical protein